MKLARAHRSSAAPQVIVNGRFLAHPFTGVQRYAYEVSRRLPVDRLVAPCGPNGETVDLDPVRVEVRRAPFKGHLWEEAVLPPALPRPSLLWSPAGSGPLAVSNQVLTIHDVSHLDHPESYGRAFRAWYRVALPLLARRVRRIVTVSEYSRDRIVARLGVSPDRVEVVPEGVDERFRTLPAGEVADRLRRLGICRPYVLAVGAVSARKNFARLFEAWTMIAGSHRTVDLVVVGKTGLTFAGGGGHKGLPQRAHTFEHVSDDQLVDLYNGALVFAYPSLFEGFGLPILEAMACGTAVVASNSTSVPEVAGDAAILVDPTDPTDIADGLSRVLADNGLRNNLAIRGVERARQFSWDDTAARVWKILQEEAAML